MVTRDWLKRASLFIFLILIPTQLGKHFWFDWSYVRGIRVDYLSPTLYLLDIAWIILFSLNFSKKEWNKKTLNKNWGWIILFLVNIWVAQVKWIAIYRWIRVFQAVYVVDLIKKNKDGVWNYLKTIIPIWIIGESMMGWAQIAKGSSLNGWFYFLGERRFSFNTISIAQMSVWGKGILRAYGTFSHPNSMAAFILLSLLIWLMLRKKINSKIWWWTVWFFGFWGIIISGSRLVWCISGLLMMSYFWVLKKKIKNLAGLGIILLGVIIIITAMVSVNYNENFFLGGWDKESLNKRNSLNLVAWEMIRDNMFFGRGLGNFFYSLPDYQEGRMNFWLQPVHNVILLWWCETGLIGLALVGLKIIKSVRLKKLRVVEILILTFILISSMFDHYWLSLAQNYWILAVVWSLIC